MAEVNDSKDQEERSWGEKIAKYFNMGVKPKPKKLTDEETVEAIKMRGGRA